jgi:hypothetical protein
MFGLVVFAVFVFGFVGAVSASSNLVLTKLEKVQNDSAISFCVKNIGDFPSPFFNVEAVVRDSFNNTILGRGGVLFLYNQTLASGQEICETQYLNTTTKAEKLTNSIVASCPNMVNASDLNSVPPPIPIDTRLLNLFGSENHSIVLDFHIYSISIYQDVNQTSYNNTLTYSWDELRSEISNADFGCTRYKINSYFDGKNEQINQNLSKFLILGNISSWSFNNGSGLITDIPASKKGNSLSENYTIYEATYTSGKEDGRVQVLEFPSKVINQNFLKQFIGLSIEHKFANIKSKTFDNKTYLYTESTEKETTVGNPFSGESGTTKTNTLSNYFWYNGNKIVAVSSRKDYANDTEQLLTAYMNKYPSELTASRGLIERIVDFFRNLFG